MPVSLWLKQMQDQQFAATQHQWDPIDRIQRWSGIPWRFRLFDSLVVFQNYAARQSKGRLSEHSLLSKWQVRRKPLTIP